MRVTGDCVTLDDAPRAKPPANRVESAWEEAEAAGECPLELLSSVLRRKSCAPYACLAWACDACAADGADLWRPEGGARHA